MDLETGDGHDRGRIVRDVLAGEFDELSVNAGSAGEEEILHQSVEIAMHTRWTHYNHSSGARMRGVRRMPFSSVGVWSEATTSSESCGMRRHRPEMPQKMVYRNVCTEQDPPSSVALSSIKRCVAFGSQGGVELYWIDPQTGQDLNRWCPLMKPSDHLYFLAPRRHIDSETRLRLLSSPNFAEHSRDTAHCSGVGTGSRSSSWFTLSASWQFRTPHGVRQHAHAPDHSHAIPLSDGHHILFADNATGLLCLGSDKPLGSVHRLSRKFVFVPPTEIQHKGPTFAGVHAAAYGLSLGVRVVAAYGEHIVLYSIAADALRYSTAEQESAVQPPDLPFAELETLRLLKHPLSNAPAVCEYYNTNTRFDELNMKWVHYLPVNGEPPKSLEDLWPLQISGSVIGSHGDIATLAVQETMQEGLAVWAFSKSGGANAWRVDDGVRPVLRWRCSIDKDGNVGRKIVKIVW